MMWNHYLSIRFRGKNRVSKTKFLCSQFIDDSFFAFISAHRTESEFDEDSNDEEPALQTPQTGVDDGFFIGTPGEDPEKAIPHNGNGHRGRRPSQGDGHNFPQSPGITPNVVSDISLPVLMQIIKIN